MTNQYVVAFYQVFENDLQMKQVTANSTFDAILKSQFLDAYDALEDCNDEHEVADLCAQHDLTVEVLKIRS